MSRTKKSESINLDNATKIQAKDNVEQEAVKINPFEVAKKQIGIVADEMELDEDIRKFLKRVERSLIVSIPIKMDNAKLEIFESYRVHQTT